MSLDLSLKYPTATYEVEYLYESNITHNLNSMADAAGIYLALWKPEELNITKAKELISILEKGLLMLIHDPEYYEQFNSPNGWGLYKDFVPFVENYLEACKKYPHTIIEIGR